MNLTKTMSRTPFHLSGVTMMVLLFGVCDLLFVARLGFYN